MSQLFPRTDQNVVRALGEIDYTNPFLPARVELERRALGPAYIDAGEAQAQRHGGAENPNRPGMLARAEPLLTSARERLEDPDTKPSKSDLDLYEGLAIFALYHRWIDQLGDLIDDFETTGKARAPWYGDFEAEFLRDLRPGGRRLPLDPAPAHFFSLVFQVARAFHHIFANIYGTSHAVVELRANIWQSIFSHDIKRYQRALYARMADVSTLVTGPSGTGKELVARAVGRSGYIPFDERAKTFTGGGELFFALNLSALSPTLIESELFGHQRGAFTNAQADRKGWFESCLPHGAVFLDEIAETSLEIQVKLLRVLQTREFQRIGDSKLRTFEGKLISATNRDLPAEIAAGRFREDLYYRVCSDRIVTPSLASQIAGSPHGLEELRELACFVGERLVGEEAEELADEVVLWVSENLPADYAWPGNFRELEQCVRNVLIRREYRPETRQPTSTLDGLAASFLRADASADRILRTYCTLVYARVGSFDGAARVLGLDRRTVKSKLDEELLAELR